MYGREKQHYVPQLYLRRYTEGKESIYVYDKIEQKISISHWRCSRRKVLL